MIPLPKKYLMTRELKALGWTAGMIKLLGRSEKTIELGVMHHGDGYKSRLWANAWSEQTVSATQATEQWKKLSERQQKQKDKTK